MPETPRFDFSGLTFSVRDAAELSSEQWAAVQAMEREAFAASLPHIAARGGIDRLLHTDEPDYYRQARLDPQAAVARGDQNPGWFRRPRVALAHEGDQPVGYLYSADNTSGSNVLWRAAKMWTPPGLNVLLIGGRRYVWNREVAVHPEVRKRGIATALGYLALRDRHPKQQAAVYVWPSLNEGIVGVLQHVYGFQATGYQKVYPFKDGYKVHQTRMVAPVGRVLKRILQVPGARGALERIDIVT